MNASRARLRAADLFSPTVAALISVLVNYGGTFVLVFQAAELARLTPAQTASWVWAVSVGVGVTGALLSWRYKAPIITAWSTPGVAFLATVMPFTPYGEVIGAYVISALGFIALGLSGALFQSLTRNPLGSPDVIGLTAGAAAGAVAATMIWPGVMPVAWGAAAGALAATLGVWFGSGAGFAAPRRMVIAGIAVGALAFAFGYFAFRSRIRGVYFSIMTQALTFAGMLLFFRNETGFGGNNGFTDFKTILGFSISAPATRATLFLATVALLAGSLYLGFRLARSKFGRVLTALRDAENRLMFCGYDPRGYKLFIWTLSAVLCGLAGALYVPQVGIINPSEMAPTQSIEAAVWVALGGRGTLIGPLLGAGIVNGMKSWFTVAFPEYWLFALGALFIVVTLYLPKGVIGLIKRRGEE